MPIYVWLISICMYYWDSFFFSSWNGIEVLCWINRTDATLYPVWSFYSRGDDQSCVGHVLGETVDTFCQIGRNHFIPSNTYMFQKSNVSWLNRTSLYIEHMYHELSLMNSLYLLRVIKQINFCFHDIHFNMWQIFNFWWNHYRCLIAMWL